MEPQKTLYCNGRKAESKVSTGECPFITEDQYFGINYVNDIPDHTNIKQFVDCVNA